MQRVVRCTAFFVIALTAGLAFAADSPTKQLRVGLIGLDTSHVMVFTNLINTKAEPGSELAGLRVVAGFPGGTKIPSSADRVGEYTEKLRGLGLDIVDSIPALLEKVDVVLLESVDGNPHLEQVLPVLKAGKRVFVDKPIAASLVDAMAIFEAAKKYNVPVFSSSSLRFYDGARKVKAGDIGEVLGCDTYGNCSLEPSHSDLYWYGIHGVESLYACMGTGCESVTRLSTPDFELAAGRWRDGRIGTFRGLRKGKIGFGGTVFGTKSNAQLGAAGGYEPLLIEIAKFFRTGKPPVSAEETIEMFAFMEASDESKRRGGAPVSVESVLKQAQSQVAARLAAVEAKATAATTPFKGAATVEFYGYNDCIRLDNGQTRVVLCPRAGGRVLEYALNGVNALYLPAGQEGWEQAEGKPDAAMNAGRFDIGPEQTVPRRAKLWAGRWHGEIVGDRQARLVSQPDESTGVQLTREFTLDEKTSRLDCRQTIKNISSTPKEYCHWSRTFALGGGICFVPLTEPSRFPNGYVMYEPQTAINFRPTDPNITRQDQFLVINGAPRQPKLGMDSAAGWFAYLMQNDLLFVKRFAVDRDRPYNEVAGLTISIWYPDGPMCELEPIGPREKLAPGQAAGFTETWYLVNQKYPQRGQSIAPQVIAEAVARDAR